MFVIVMSVITNSVIMMSVFAINVTETVSLCWVSLQWVSLQCVSLWSVILIMVIQLSVIKMIGIFLSYKLYIPLLLFILTYKETTISRIIYISPETQFIIIPRTIRSVSTHWSRLAWRVLFLWMLWRLSNGHDFTCFVHLHFWGLYYKNILTIVSDNRKWCLFYKCASPWP